jgi:excinuclease ABC subunit B
MFNGDQARKRTLVEHGFRLPSALDNRPMSFEEFLSVTHETIFLSATPGPFEQENAFPPVEQLIRPTGIVDPPIEIRPLKNQIDDLIEEIRQCTERHERTLVTTLTKRTAEDLAQYLEKTGIKVQYLHSDIDAVERVEILRELRAGTFDALIGINLLREGLDLPEVALVAVLDADKEGFLRSETALIQTAGRAARHLEGRVILYADRITGSMQRMMEKCAHRREKQIAYNIQHHITPKPINKAIQQTLRTLYKTAEETVEQVVAETPAEYSVTETIRQLETEMLIAATDLEFERAATLRDRIQALKQPTKTRPNKIVVPD